ncbi:uncharacterized protein ACNS7B_021133 [Menidia menidia]
MVTDTGKRRLLDGCRIGETVLHARELTLDEMVVSFLAMPAYIGDEAVIAKLAAWKVEAVSEVKRRMWPACVSLVSVNGEAEQVDFIDSSVTEEEEMRTDPPTPTVTAPPLEHGEASSSSQSQDSAAHRSSLHMEVGPFPSASPSPLSPSSPTLEERKRPGTLFIWQERERLQQQQREKACLLKSSTKTGSHVATPPPTGSSSCDASPENGNTHSGLRQRCASADQMSSGSASVLLQRSSSRTSTTGSEQCDHSKEIHALKCL